MHSINRPAYSSGLNLQRTCFIPVQGNTLFRNPAAFGALVAIITRLLTQSAAAEPNPCLLPATHSRTVTAIVDARTLRLDDAIELRLSSILAPTAYDSPAAPAKWPAERTAIVTLKKRLLGRDITIAIEPTRRDRYGRQLGHALLPTPAGRSPVDLEQTWVQAIMVRAGHARVALTPVLDRACARLLLHLEAAASMARRGLWQSSAYQVRKATEPNRLLRYRSTYQVVEGVVARVAPSRSAIYLNFGADWKRDFTAKFPRADLRRAGIGSRSLARLANQAIRVRGWIEQRNGPLITVWRPEQIELLKRTANGDIERHAPPRLFTALPTSRE